MAVALATNPVSIHFGAHTTHCQLDEGGVRLDLAIPCLARPDSESVGFFDETAETSASVQGDFFLNRGDGWLAGCVVRNARFPLEKPVYQLYRDLFEIVGPHRPIYRIWNYLPDINGKTNSLENYRWFNVGRHRAYYERYEQKMARHISAASAVGMREEKIALAFIAGIAPVRGIENPDQIPAYRYPSAYGPKSPSFIRGAAARVGGIETAFLSGTSSIKGHDTVGSGNFTSQFNTTIGNIRIVAEEMGCPTAVSFTSTLRRHFKFYLRHPSDFPLARRLFAQTVGEQAAADTVFLQADICRSDLALEIEGIFTDPLQA